VNNRDVLRNKFLFLQTEFRKMPRINLDLPEKFTFSTEIPIRITDLNYGKHVGNDSILSLIHEARVQFIRKTGYEDELNIDGFGIIMTDVGIVFKNEILYGLKVKIEIGIKDFTKYGFDIYYRLTDAAAETELATAKTGIVFYDYEKRKIANIPYTFIIRLNL
jgi:acyl-CoA thioester hydrolase